ncbi:MULTISPECIES: NifU family protein [Acidithiobacillus]|jgi:Fe-S cluster biogenesis protein NfuA|uniref:NifU family protein n=1 Tax=Acidithiobacillus TaxID=119977 RepID=UPI00230FD810|nr:MULTISPECIES: NifU family protein [Acidithiobacillus]MDA8245966.1 NifU family protein [Acidithiobacillus sp.]WCE93994.1 NifU family protein [Acidithiobacillus ferriphilus]
MSATAKSPIRFYSEDELDALEAEDPLAAAKIAHAQAMAERGLDRRRRYGSDDPMPEPAAVAEAVQAVRHILNRDGGDIELVEIIERDVRVRMKGACAGCPNAVIDLKQVVERIVGAVPGVVSVSNTF